VIEKVPVFAGQKPDVRLQDQKATAWSKDGFDFGQGLHEYLEAFVVEASHIDRAIGQQFRFA